MVATVGSGSVARGRRTVLPGLAGRFAGARQDRLGWPVGAWANRALIALYGLAGGVATLVWATFTRVGGTPVDARCFYDADPAHPYWRTDYAFLYSPAAAQAMVPLHLLSFEAFVALVRGVELVALYALTGPFLPLVVFWSPVASELNAANINLLIVAVGVWGLRWPALWSFVLLTKVTPGIGLLWFAARREWRQLAIAIGVTGAISLGSLALAPGLWLDWVAFMTTIQPSDGVPLWVRMLGAALLVVWGGRTDRRWTVVLAVVIATPRLYLMTPAMLVGLLYYLRPQLGRIPAWPQSAAVGAP